MGYIFSKFWSAKVPEIKQCVVCEKIIDVHVVREKIGKQCLYYCSYHCFGRRQK